MRSNRLHDDVGDPMLLRCVQLVPEAPRERSVYQVSAEGNLVSAGSVGLLWYRAALAVDVVQQMKPPQAPHAGPSDDALRVTARVPGPPQPSRAVLAGGRGASRRHVALRDRPD
jgi:hypothetical protein